jgi:hypothetical protein
MNEAHQFGNVNAWKNALGHLPVWLRYDEENIERYVLLNGSRGNFCLDFVGGVDPLSRRAVAWSCDVGHHITCADGYISVIRWDRSAPEERFSAKSVFSQIHEFHRYLEKSTPDQSKRIVAHVLGVFRRIRAATQDDLNGLESMPILLHMLASVASGVERISLDNEIKLWGLSEDVGDRSARINDATWESLYQDLSGAGSQLPPDFPLVLRHASGALFQDAHLEANSPLNQWLPGFERPVSIGPGTSPNETGVYFTPSALARTLAQEATLEVPATVGRPLTVFDPACGSGELLKETLRLLRIRGYQGEVHVIGWDKSPAAVSMARFVLAWEKRAWAERVRVEISEHDSVTETTWPNGVDVLVMNPPFKSWQLMLPQEQEAVRGILGESGKPNLAMAFARRGLSVLSAGGVLAMITPNSLLEGSSSSARETRGALAQDLTPQLVARLGDQTLFARALVDAGIYVGRRKSDDYEARTGVLWADNRLDSWGGALRGLRRWRGAEALPIADDGFSVYRRTDIATNNAPWIARRYEAWSLYQRFQESAKMQAAKEVFDIHQGIRLGNDVFIVPKDYFLGLSKGERRFFRPAVMNPSIVDGRLRDAYYAFYPYTEGLSPIESEEDLKRVVPKYYKDHLSGAKSALRGRTTLDNQSALKWWDLLRSRSWQRKAEPKIVSKYFGGTRPFALDKSGDFVVVVGNGWLLKNGGIGESAQDSNSDDVYQMTEAEAYLVTITYLCSNLAHDLLEYMSVQVSGGQLDLSNKYVCDLPIPKFSAIQPSELNKMIQMGEEIATGRVDQWSKVDELVLSVLA